MKSPQLFITFSATKQMSLADYELKKTLRAAILNTLIYEGFESDAEISLTVCDNEYIQSINKQFRDIDRATDVLSFPMYEDGDFEMSECISGAMLGDIVISVDRAKEQAQELGNSFVREVCFLAIHSTLHLLGYDHERSKDDEEAQCLAQREIIAELEI